MMCCGYYNIVRVREICRIHCIRECGGMLACVRHVEHSSICKWYSSVISVVLAVQAKEEGSRD